MLIRKNRENILFLILNFNVILHIFRRVELCVQISTNELSFLFYFEYNNELINRLMMVYQLNEKYLISFDTS